MSTQVRSFSEKFSRINKTTVFQRVLSVLPKVADKRKVFADDTCDKPRTWQGGLLTMLTVKCLHWKCLFYIITDNGLPVVIYRYCISYIHCTCTSLRTRCFNLLSLQHDALHKLLCTVYSGTCLERPPHMVCQHRWSLVTGSIILNAKIVWSVKTGYLSWQWSLKIVSLYVLCKSKVLTTGI